MKRPFVLVSLLAMLLYGCGGKSKAPAEPSPSTRAEASVVRQSAGPLSQLGSQSESAEDALGDYVGFPACGIKIRQPEGLEKQDSFDGFGDPDTQASIMAVSIRA